RANTLIASQSFSDANLRCCERRRDTPPAVTAKIGNRQRIGLNLSSATPPAMLSPVWPWTDTGCRATVRFEPPIRTSAPSPAAKVASAAAPTYERARREKDALVGENTIHTIGPPVVTPMSTPSFVIVPW